MNRTLYQSAKIPGLVMWANGAIVTVRMKEGRIELDRRGDPIPVCMHGRWVGDCAEAVFAAVEQALATNHDNDKPEKRA
jgi:hypothetical protein